MLIRNIEENNLSQFDSGSHLEILPPKSEKAPEQNQVLNNGNPTEAAPISSSNFAVVAHPSRIMENNRIKYIIIKDGDSKEKLEKEFQLLKWELQNIMKYLAILILFLA